MKVLNRTHYYSPYTRVYNEVPEKDSFATESAKRVSYQQRLYFEFQDIKRTNGQAFFYTFTYNDTSLPHAYGFPCFNYDHVRLLTNGIIKHVLSRKYGSQLRYFVACELGEGGLTHNYVGKRGVGMNPHYHVIFFVSPKRDADNNPVAGYTKIDPKAFRELCRKVWQYRLDSNRKPVYCDWREARFGHVQEGNNLGLVDSADALGYVAKYVTKSPDDCKRDSNALVEITKKINEEGYSFNALYNFRLYEAFNLSDDTTTTPTEKVPYTGNITNYLDSDSRAEFLRASGLLKYQAFRRNPHNPIRDQYSFPDFCRQYQPMDHDFFLRFVRFYRFIYVPDRVRKEYAAYKNKYGNKVRCSKSLGVYGLTQVKQFGDDIKFTIDFSTMTLNPTPCLYYIRKMFYDAFKCPYTGNVLYTLNDAGVDYKVNHLHRSLCDLTDTVKTAIGFCLNDLNKAQLDVRLAFDARPSVISRLRALSNCLDLDKILYRYAAYELIYKYRHTDDWLHHRLNPDFAIDDLKSDYRDFLCNIPAWGDHTLLIELKKGSFLSFADHPVFAPYKQVFADIDIAFSAYQGWNSSYYKEKFDKKQSAKKAFNASRISMSVQAESLRAVNPALGLDLYLHP